MVLMLALPVVVTFMIGTGYSHKESTLVSKSQFCIQRGLPETCADESVEE